MKPILRLLILALPAMILSSCHVDGHAHGRVNHPGYQPARTHTEHHHYDHRPAPKRSGPLINANTNLGVRL